MAKKQTKQTAAANTEPHYEAGYWKKLPQWTCNHCAFDTLDGLDVMAAHLRKQHQVLITDEPLFILENLDSEVKQI